MRTSLNRLLGLMLASIAALWLAIDARRAEAQPSPNPPESLAYQGFLVDANGFALATNAPRNYDIQFRIFSDANSANPQALLWSEQQTVTVDRGNFSVILGEGVAVPGQPRPSLSAVFRGATASERYIGLLVNGIGPGNTPVEINPRLRLLTSPYAFLAQQANKLVRADGTDLLGGNNGAMFLDGTLSVRTNGFIEFGGGLTKEGSAGKIAYSFFTPNALDIVGAGTTGTNRQIKMWAEGGTTFTGPVAATVFNGSGAGLTGVFRIQPGGHLLLSDTNTPSGSAGYGSALIFSGAPGGDNTDPLWISRYNAAANESQIRVSIGNDPGLGTDKLVIGTMAGNDAGFTQSGTWSPLFGFTAKGYLGVGTDSPETPLDVRGGDLKLSQGNVLLDNDKALQGKNAAGFYEACLWPRASDNGTYINYGSGGFYLRSAFTGATVMSVLNNGYVGLGTPTPQWRLELVDGEPRMRMRVANTTHYMEVGRSGDGFNGFAFVGLNNNKYTPLLRYAYYEGGTAWLFGSDRKLKKDIIDAEPMLDRALRVQVRRFRWKEGEEGSEPMLGVIAQELQPLFPGMVSELAHPETHEKHLTVGYGDFGVIAIKAIQELKAGHDMEVKQLRAELAEIRAQLKEVLAATKRPAGEGVGAGQAAAVRR